MSVALGAGLALQAVVTNGTGRRQGLLPPGESFTKTLLCL